MVRVAVVGCAHGMLDDIYATVRHVDALAPARPVELLLCCGDFECMRNTRDLATLACPPKFRAMHAFHAYYSGAKVAPVLTVFVGGNHEASGYLSELHYGGWVAPNMFYLGAAGSVNVAGLRLAGLSGIFKAHDYAAGRFERLPLDAASLRSIYHVRELEVFQLAHLQPKPRAQETSKSTGGKRLDVFLSHDWPRGVEQHGDVRALVRRKPFFQDEIRTNSLGSPAGELLLHQLKPKHWFAAHLHVKFAAIVRHGVFDDVEEEEGGEKAAEAEVTTTTAASEDSNASAAPVATKPPVEQVTKFLALDKCLPRREFLQVLDIPTDDGNASSSDGEQASGAPRAPPKIMFDMEWLAVLRATHHLASASRYAPRVPEQELRIEESDVEWVRARHREFVKEKGLNKADGEWITDFVKTAPAHGEESDAVWAGHSYSGNPQTDLLLEMLKLPHVVTSPYAGGGSSSSGPGVAVADPNEIDLDDDDDDEEDASMEDGDTSEAVGRPSTESEASVQPSVQPVVADPNEVDLDDL